VGIEVLRQRNPNSGGAYGSPDRFAGPSSRYGYTGPAIHPRYETRRQSARPLSSCAVAFSRGARPISMSS